MAQSDSSTTRPLFDLDPNEPLQRLPDLSVHLQSDGSIRIDLEDRALLCGPHALRILETFSQPTTFRHALEALRTDVLGTQDWVDLNDTIMNLFRAGALEPVVRASKGPAMRTGYDAAIQHINMLNDRGRTSAFLDAIREVVRPGDVVVDIGTGTGVLSVAAAQAGAKHVYAIEVGSIGKVAEAVFAANGFADRITLVPGLSTHVSLPERADVLISEMIGDEALQERALQTTRDAIKRFLKPEARFVPRTIRICAIAVEIPESVVARYRFRESSLVDWQEWYGIDFGPLERGNAPAPLRIFAHPRRPREWPRRSEPVLLAEVDFASGSSPSITREAEFAATEKGAINGIVSYFELGLSPGVQLSVDPQRADEDCHWRLPVWLLPDPLEVEQGERLSFHYAYGSENRHGWVSLSRAAL
jgi:protein arginine N-methyltransferase 1